MPHTGNVRRRPTARRALRREVPSTVALLADAEDFAAMQRYATFAFDDHAAYLKEMESLLRTLSSQSVHTSVAVFDPAGYEEFCTDAGLDPDRPDSRARYTADVAGSGATVRYEGQPIEELVPELVSAAERHAAFEHAADLLASAGTCGDCGQDRGRAAYERSAQALTRLLEALGPGTHHAVCSVPVDGAPLIAVLHAECGKDGLMRLPESDALAFCTVLGAGIATDSRGGIVARSSGSPDAPFGTVRGWALRDGWPEPLTEAEVFSAYCTDADTGEPVPPEPGVDYRPGIELPRPERRC